jgi:two-component system, chemotaxis family, protein-glutamate methylesterase/glutaminase
MLTADRGRRAHFPARIEAVVIGGSAGAIEALGEILPLLPASTPWPVLVVVHVAPHEPSLLPSLYRARCELPVREPTDKEPVRPGVWFAPADYHLLVESSRTFSLSIDGAVNHSRPSLDVLFESAADAYGEGLVCVVLTGASGDGANGAKAVRDAGGFVIAQDPATAEVALMPTEAIARSGAQWIARPAEIGEALRGAALGSTT